MEALRVLPRASVVDNTCRELTGRPALLPSALAHQLRLDTRMSESVLDNKWAYGELRSFFRWYDDWLDDWLQKSAAGGGG